MNFRCGERSGRLRCALGPQHAGMHSALIRLDNEIGIVNWGMNEPEEPVIEEVYPVAEIVREITPTLREIAPPVRDTQGRFTYSTMGFAGTRRTRATLRNLYAGAEEGVHTSWGLYGHEVMPLPTLDEIELEMA